MKAITDLHIHSKYSRATSKNLDLANIEKYARLKGLNLVGTGDFQHPKWQKELKEQLTEVSGTGIYQTKTGFNFIFQTEISFIYSQDGEGRRIHNVVLAPNVDVVEQISETLSKKGRLDYDGRPIFGISCVEFTEMMMSISKNIEIIPAHAWTPWFSLFGSMSGFDSIQECFQDQSKHIHAIETGLSSDPAMNWRLSQLDNIALVSFSDAHSFWPWRIGREATIFDLKELTYKNIIDALRTREGLCETIEFFPEEGKYHYDGHRNCNVVLPPSESIKNKDLCPKCGKTLTIGVAHRVEELADRPEGFKPRNAVPYRNLIPLSELIAAVIKSPVASKKVWENYNKLLKEFGSEFNVVLDASEEKLKTIVGEKIAEAIINNRNQQIKFNPGYDGVYGEPIIDETVELHQPPKIKHKQTGLEDFSA